MTADLDKKRREEIDKNRPPTEEENQMKLCVCVYALQFSPLDVDFSLCSYQNYLRQARTANFQDMASLGTFYKAGLDYVGRQIVVFVGRYLPVSKIDMNKVYHTHL